MKISIFDATFNRQAFTCGIEELDAYLKRFVSQDIKRDAAVCFILHEDESTEILGYYTLSAFSVGFQDVPEADRKRLPRYPQIPATMIGRLAIAKEYQGQGIGEILLIDALRRAWKNHEVIASWAVVVDAINESAERFYQKYGFRLLENESSRLYIPMKELGNLFG